jgi:hypothetical protein
MDPYDAGLERLSREQCLRLLGSVPLGRIVYTRGALPAVELVNFTLDDGDIVIRTDPSGKLAAATRSAVVAFEADSADLSAHTGWSVTVVGYSQAVLDTGEVRRLERLSLDSWVPGRQAYFIKIPPTIVNGRRIGGVHRLAG